LKSIPRNIEGFEMAYVPINVAAFVTSYSGAISGMATSGWITDSSPVNYASIAKIAGAFAQAFDTVWDNVSPLNNLEIQAISQIVSENFAHRTPGPQADLRYYNPNNWQVSATACAALVLESDAFFAGEGINPGFPGGGSIPLPIPVSDLDAIGIPDGYVLQVSGEIAIWGPLPTAFDITAFNATINILQVGQTIINPTFTASYNRPPVAISITDTEGNNNPIALPGTLIISPHTFVKNVAGQSVNFTLHANDTINSDTAQRGIVWGENVYWGEVPDLGVYDAAFIQALDNQSLRVSANGNYGFNAPPADSSFFCALSSYGLTIANFFVGIFPFACTKVAGNVPFINAQGIAQTFDVFRSDNIGLGVFNLSVQ
jgi:hypothetical protein